MVYYLQVNGENVITDVITYPAMGYVAYEISYPLPAGINGGCYTWDGILHHLDPLLKAKSDEGLIRSAIDDYTLELIDGGMI